MTDPERIAILVMLFILALGYKPPAEAQTLPEVTIVAPKADFRVGLHLGSQHFGSEAHKFNNINPGGYVVYNGWTLGGYYNSERRPSFYAGYTAEWELHRNVKPAVTVGAITGYVRSPVLPMVVPSVLIADHFRVSFVPKLGAGSAAVVHLSLEYKF